MTKPVRCREIVLAPLTILVCAGALCAQTITTSAGELPPTIRVSVTRIARLDVPVHPAIAAAPNGRFFAALQTRPDPVLWVVPAAGGDPFAFRRMWAAFAPRWAPTGERVGFIAAVGPPRIWTVEVDPETGRPVDPPRMLIRTAANAYAFAPDGDAIAMVPSRSTAAGASQIRIVDWHSRATRILTRERGLIYWLDWSPDGRWIYYGLAPAAADPEAAHEVRRVPLGGGPPEPLVRTGQFFGLSPDGEYLLCRGQHGKGGEGMAADDLALIRRDGTIVATLDLPFADAVVRWGSDSRTLITARRDEGDYELIRYQLDPPPSQH